MPHGREVHSVLPPSNVVDVREARARRARQSRPGPERIAEVLERAKNAEAERGKWRTVLQQAYELFLPQRDGFTTNDKGAKKGREVLDSTPGRSLKKWASRKQQSLLPPNRRWARLVAGLDTPDEDKDRVNRELDRLNDVLFGELNRSNMSTEVHESILDAGISTGAFAVEDGGDDRPIRFTAAPAHELSVEEGPFGTVDNVYRRHKMKLRTIERRWPLFDFSDESLRLMERDPTQEIEIVDCVVRDDRFGHFDHMVLEAEEQHLGFWEPFEVSPWVVFGALKLSNETYRRGPALDALPDARTLQRVKELELRHGAIAVAGVFTGVDDEVFDVWNTILAPGAIIPVARHESLQPLEIGANFDIGRLIISDLQDSIKETMEALNLGSVEETPVRTATEVSVREQEAAIDAGSSSARLNNELVFPIIERAVAILVNRGRIVPIRVDGRDVDIELEGPISRAQDNEELLNVQGFLADVAPLGPIGLMAINAPLLAKRIAEKRKVWSDVILTEQEMAQLQAKLEEAAQAQQAQPAPAGAQQAVA